MGACNNQDAHNKKQEIQSQEKEKHDKIFRYLYIVNSEMYKKCGKLAVEEQPEASTSLDILSSLVTACKI